MKKLHIEFQNENHWPEPESARLVTLCDGRRGLRGCLSVRVSEPPAAERGTNPSPPAPLPTGEGGSRATEPLPILDFVASDETLDRYSEIIRASGWRLDHYLRNPVFQNSHQYGDVIFTLGKALETRVVAGSLRQRIQFAPDINPMARIAYGLYKGGFLNAVSVGFIPIRWEDSPSYSALDEKSAEALQGESRNARSTALPPLHRHGGEGRGEGAVSFDCAHICSVRASSIPRRIFLEQELLEVSAVSIPANPNALVMGIRSGAVEQADVREVLEVFRAALSNDEWSEPDWPIPNDERSMNDKCRIQEFRSNDQAIRNADTRALGIPDDEARSRLLRAVKGLAEVMKQARN